MEKDAAGCRALNRNYYCRRCYRAYYLENPCRSLCSAAVAGAGGADLAALAGRQGIEHPRSDCRRLWPFCLYHRRRSGIGYPGADRGSAHFPLWNSGPVRVADPKAG